MAEWWRNPAYDARKAAGEVVTPGIVDWGGLVNAFNAPYDERVGRLPDGPMPPPTGNAVRTYYNAGFAGPTDLKSNRDGSFPSGVANRMELPPITPQQHLAFRDASRWPSPNVGTGPAGYRLAAGGSDRIDIPPANPQAPSLPNPMPLGLKSFTGSGATPAGYRSNVRFASSPKASDGIIDISHVDLSDRAAQNTADSEGKPVRPKNGKVYYPGGKAPAGNVSGSLSARDNRGPLSQALGLKSGGLGGLFGGLFGGGGGLFGGGNRGASAAVRMVPGVGAAQPARAAPTYTTTPFQEDRFQTTTGAQMPSSMNNERWTTGY